MEKIGTTGLAAASILAGFFQVPAEAQRNSSPSPRPNILFAISDDQSYPYASAYGTKGLNTPAFDYVAKAGVLFNNAFVAAPGSSPSRAAILTRILSQRKNAVPVIRVSMNSGRRQ